MFDPTGPSSALNSLKDGFCAFIYSTCRPTDKTDFGTTMKIAILTAGGAGMFCGSCMQDNTLVRALRLAGADALLLPTYTPIRVDEEN